MPELIPAGPGTPEWLAARRQGVTATDIVTILGLSSYDSVYSLFWRKLGQVPDTEDSDRFRLGRDLEPYIFLRWLEANAGLDSSGPDLWYQQSPGLFRNSARAWQLATLDAIVGKHPRHRDVPLTDLSEPLELKTWADADRHSRGDAPPARVRAQVLWQMDVMDVTSGHVGVVFLPSGEFRSYTIEHDMSGCEHTGCPADPNNVPHQCTGCSVCADLDLMRDAGEEFMARLRLELPPPDPDASAATLAAVRARFAKAPDKEAEVHGSLWRGYVGVLDEIKELEESKRAAEVMLREQAGEASVLTVDGQPVARRIIVDAAVKAHTRHQDYLKRITPRGDDSE